MSSRYNKQKWNINKILASWVAQTGTVSILALINCVNWIPSVTQQREYLFTPRTLFVWWLCAWLRPSVVHNVSVMQNWIEKWHAAAYKLSLKCRRVKAIHILHPTMATGNLHSSSNHGDRQSSFFTWPWRQAIFILPLTMATRKLPSSPDHVTKLTRNSILKNSLGMTA